MPRVTSVPAFRPRGLELVKVIWGELVARELTVDDLADRTGISRDRLYRRKARPEEFTVDELVTICRNLSIPIEELRAAIKY